MENVFQIVVLRLCLAALAVLLATLALVGLRRVGRLLLRRLEPVALAALLPMAVLLTDFAGEKTTNMPLRVIQPVASQTFSSCGAVTNSDWLARGAYEDWFRIPATNWWARTADGWLDGVTVFAWCEFRPDIRTADAYPRPFPQKLSLAPMANWLLLAGNADPQQLNPSTSQHSLFWHGVTGSNTLVMTWQNGLYARCATNLVSFQAELFNDGSVAYRYDGSSVATNDFVVPLELPFDRDGDGLENSVDPDPLVAGPDAHGTNSEWYNTVCSNVLMAVATSCDPPVELSWLDGVNSNAYYFVDVVAERGPAPIWFTGDRPSRLGDPVVVARAGETNRVPLLIGVDYAVTSDTPFSVSFPVDYMYPVVETNEPCVARIRWPLEFHFVETNVTGATRIYRVDVTPFDPGGTFSWETRSGGSSGGLPLRGSGCDCVLYAGRDVSFSCFASCTCPGSCVARGTYDFECASFPLTGGECRCGFDDPLPSDPPPPDQPSFSVWFSDAAVIFEDTYQDKPGIWKPKRSTRVLVSVSATGGTYGGSFTLATENLDKLTPVACGPMVFPSSMDIVPYGTYCAFFLCEGATESGSAGDVRMSGTFVENVTGESFSSSNRLTVVRVEFKPIVTAPDNDRPYRHAFGVCEYVEHLQYPSAPAVSWNPVTGSEVVYAGSPHYKCPLWGVDNPLRAEIGNVRYAPKIQVVEPRVVSSEAIGYDVYPNVNKGEAGGIGMRLYLYANPQNVSFSQIMIEEVPCANCEVEGYFENPYFNVISGHTRIAGAGIWADVDFNNKIGDYDIAAYLDKIPWLTPDGNETTNAVCAWTEGRVYIDNPFGWNVLGTTNGIPPYKEFGHDIRDTIRLDSQGRVGVFKLDNWVERTTNDIVRMYGPRVKKND